MPSEEVAMEHQFFIRQQNLKLYRSLVAASEVAAAKADARQEKLLKLLAEEVANEPPPRACVLSAHTLSVQKGSLRYPALFDFAAVLHNEMDVIAASNNHENGPQTGVRPTYGGLSGPLQARTA